MCSLSSSSSEGKVSFGPGALRTEVSSAGRSPETMLSESESIAARSKRYEARVRFGPANS
jgi:hypothetical protein